MTRIRRNRRAQNRLNPQLKTRARQGADSAQRQQTVLPGPRRSEHHHQHRIDKWCEGTAELDAKMRAAMREPHAFEPMGPRPPFDDTCEVCSAAREGRLPPRPGRTIGRRIHW